MGGGPSGDSPVPPAQYGNVAAMAVTLAQTLGQNVGMMWNKHRTAAGTCHPPGSGMGTLQGHQAGSRRAGTPSPSPLLPGDCRCPDSWLGCIMEDTGWVPAQGGTAIVPRVPCVTGGDHRRGSCPVLGGQPCLAMPPGGVQGADGGPRPRRYYLPRKFSRCSIDEYNQFLQDGGGSCLFNKPLKVTGPP